MSELYELPEGWEWKKLDSLTEVNIGKTPTRSKKEYFQGDKVWLSIRDLKEDYVSTSKEGLTDEAIKKSNIKIVLKGTLLMSFKLTLGRTAFADCDLYTNEAIASLPIKDDKKLDKHFLKYSIKIIDLEKEVDNAVKGKTLNKKKIKNLDIPLPLISEQKRIVAKLDALFERIDSAISLHQKNIDDADKFMGTVLNEVFGELEGKYESRYLKNYCQITSSKRVHKADYVSEGVPFYRIKDIIQMSKNIKLTNTQYIKEETFNKFDSKFGSPKCGDILITAVGATLGYAYLVNEDDDKFYFKDGNLVWLKNINNLSQEYLKFIFSSTLFRNYLDSIAKGAAQPAITIIKLKEFQLPIPPLQTQQKTVTYLDQISQKVEKLKEVQKEKLQNLKDLKASLLDRAFRGEL